MPDQHKRETNLVFAIASVDDAGISDITVEFFILNASDPPRKARSLDQSVTSRTSHEKSTRRC
jgi:hypothetical protein